MKGQKFVVPLDDQLNGPGFFVSPVDPGGNTRREFDVSSGVKWVRQL